MAGRDSKGYEAGICGLWVADMVYDRYRLGQGTPGNAVDCRHLDADGGTAGCGSLGAPDDRSSGDAYQSARPTQKISTGPRHARTLCDNRFSFVRVEYMQSLYQSIY